MYRFEFQPQNCKRNLYPERIENIFFDERRNKLYMGVFLLMHLSTDANTNKVLL